MSHSDPTRWRNKLGLSKAPIIIVTAMLLVAAGMALWAAGSSPTRFASAGNPQSAAQDNNSRAVRQQVTETPTAIATETAAATETPQATETAVATGTSEATSTQAPATMTATPGLTQTPGATGTPGERQVTLCHATGSSNNPYVQITVGESALPAHQGHGDIYPVPPGGCPRGGTAVATGTPAATRTPAMTSTPRPSGTAERKVTLCHVTGSRTNPYVQITVSENALPAHTAHGDIYPVPPGGCPRASTATPGAQKSVPKAKPDNPGNQGNQSNPGNNGRENPSGQEKKDDNPGKDKGKDDGGKKGKP